MVLDRIAEIIAAATKRPVRKSSSIPYMPSGLLPPTGYGHGFGFSSTGQKANLLLSSSLQDLTAYHRVDLEDVKGSSETDVIYSKQSHPFLKENGASSFSKEKVPQVAPFKLRKWTQVFMVLLGLIFFSFLMFAILYFVHSNWFGGASMFYVVLDCGSTGTRIYIYQASVNNNKDGNLPVVLQSYLEGFHRKTKRQSWRAYDRMETEPGLDKLLHNASGLKDAIKPLLRWAEKQIPKKSHKTTSLFAYATAGVRRLPSSDSEWVLDHLRSILQNSSFLCKKEWVKTISGMEEAYYGWIALNYQNGTLGAIPKKATFGALDLGGSSLQVTFETVKPVHEDTSMDLNIGAVSHHLSAYSLSGYGLNDAFDKSVVHLLKGLSNMNHKVLSGENIEILHPCLHSGYKEQYFCSQCASMLQEAGSPHNEVKNPSTGGKGRTPVWLIGEPNWAECSSLAKIAVNLSEWSDVNPGIDCDVQPCALSEDLPRPYGQFYAMSGFFVVYRFYNLTSDATLEDVLYKGHEFCDKPWDVAYKSVPPQPFVEQYCFRAPYIVSLLREGLHIDDNHITIGSGSTTWTEGVVLVEAGKAFSTRLDISIYGMFQLKMNPITVFAIFLISSVLAVYALSRIGNCSPRNFRRSYIPIFRHNSTSTKSVLNISSPFWFPGWSPLSSVEGRVKAPLSPTTAGVQERRFSMSDCFQGSSVQFSGTSIFPTAGSVSHIISSGRLGQMQSENGGSWAPHRGQMRLQSRRSQSREDLNTSPVELHMVKV